MPRPTRSFSRAGFTLVELLVVIGILSLLMVALLPLLGKSEENAQKAATQARIVALEQVIERFQNTTRFGDYPPDDFSDPWERPEDAIKTKGNAANRGIESCLLHLHRKSFSGQGLEDKAEWLGNTDNDKTDARNDKLQTNELKEVLDVWGNPIAYFHRRHYDMQQEMAMTGGVEIARAWRDGDGRFIHPKSYQLISAGPDGKFNTDDDVANFELPQGK